MLPPLFHDLAWDVDPAAVDPALHRRWLIARVLGRGTLKQVYAIEKMVGRKTIEEFFRNGGLDQVDVQTGSLWLTLLDLPREECTRRSSPSSSWKF
ncbi:MAG TPA: hypothetical protein VI895_13385 [Bdellovibrionota bacterium]|nr:hypothetical protein [Bdellovibrionota bacterium]